MKRPGFAAAIAFPIVVLLVCAVISECAAEEPGINSSNRLPTLSRNHKYSSSAFSSKSAEGWEYMIKPNAEAKGSELDDAQTNKAKDAATKTETVENKSDLELAEDLFCTEEEKESRKSDEAESDEASESDDVNVNRRVYNEKGERLVREVGEVPRTRSRQPVPHLQAKPGMENDAAENRNANVRARVAAPEVAVPDEAHDEADDDVAPIPNVRLNFDRSGVSPYEALFTPIFKKAVRREFNDLKNQVDESIANSIDGLRGMIMSKSLKANFIMGELDHVVLSTIDKPFPQSIKSHLPIEYQKSDRLFRFCLQLELSINPYVVRLRQEYTDKPISINVPEYELYAPFIHNSIKRYVFMMLNSYVRYSTELETIRLKRDLLQDIANDEDLRSEVRAELEKIIAQQDRILQEGNRLLHEFDIWDVESFKLFYDAAVSYWGAGRSMLKLLDIALTDGIFTIGFFVEFLELQKHWQTMDAFYSRVAVLSEINRLLEKSNIEWEQLFFLIVADLARYGETDYCAILAEFYQQGIFTKQNRMEAIYWKRKSTPEKHIWRAKAGGRCEGVLIDWPEGEDYAIIEINGKRRNIGIDKLIKEDQEYLSKIMSDDGIRTWSETQSRADGKAIMDVFRSCGRDYKEMANQLANLIKNNSARFEAGYTKGLLYVMVNHDYSKAIPFFRNCLNVDQDDVGAMNNLAICLFSRGKEQEAAQLWKKAVALGATDYQILHNIARILYRNDTGQLVCSAAAIKELRLAHRQIHLEIMKNNTNNDKFQMESGGYYSNKGWLFMPCSYGALSECERRSYFRCWINGEKSEMQPYEDPACINCRGLGSEDCPYCRNGAISIRVKTDERSIETPRGKKSVILTGKKNVPCAKCGGTGRRKCTAPGCGNGIESDCLNSHIAEFNYLYIAYNPETLSRSDMVQWAYNWLNSRRSRQLPDPKQQASL